MPQPTPRPGINGKLVVIVLLIAGTVGGYIFSRYVPRRNPKLSDPGSPYYSAPSDEEIKVMRDDDRRRGKLNP